MPGSVPDAGEVLEAMTRVCDWQLAHMPEPGNHPRHYRHWDWTNASLYTGIMAHYRASGKKKYLRTLEEFATDIDWGLGPRLHHADDLCIGQTYLEMYELKPAAYKIDRIRARVDSLMAGAIAGRKEWWWCDALFMAPPVMARLARITGEAKYLNFMDDQWWDATDFLYDPVQQLYYRDDRYRIKADGSGRREKDGSKIFWSRGNGWVLAGMARVLQVMPEIYPSRPGFEDHFRRLAERIFSLQGEDGLWKSSLLYPEGYAHGETSGSGFFCYALAWGINEGLLDRETYFPPYCGHGTAY